LTDHMQFRGKRLLKDIWSAHGTFLLSAGTLLKEEHLNHIASHNVYLTEEDVMDERQWKKENKGQVEQLVESATAEIKQIFDETKYSKSIPLIEIKKNIIPMIQDTVSSSSFYELFSMLQSKDDYTYRHNISVGIISTLIGRWMNLPASDLSLLTLGATLHDIGKAKIPEEILHKPDKLTAKEYEIMKKHTIFGYELIKNTVGMSHRCALIALQHHEREDGRGYPFGLRGNKIDFLSKIVAVADVFHELTSDRNHRSAKPFYQVINQIHYYAFDAFDPLVVNVFMQKVMYTMVGRQVLLTDGRVGEVVLINPSDPFHPLIRVEEDYVDLSRERGVRIEKIGEVDVSMLS
jgi:putative nucleotidyltransferase with HDIG domain